MPAITPEFMFDFESNMQAITENEYARLVQNLFWQKITKVRPSGSRREIIAWLLSTAQIYDQGKGGNVRFDDLVSVVTQFESNNAGTGLRLDKNQVEDLDGNGLELAAKWSGDIGAYMAYWPQKQVTNLIKTGETGIAYDAQAFFSAAHPVNPFWGNVTYANLYTGAVAGSYPGALPIDDSVDVDTALKNLGIGIAAIASIKMPNGVDPRFLTARQILVPPRMVPRAQQLTKARFIAQASSGGAGSGDVDALIRNWGLMEPIEVQEFAGDDTTWYIACEEMATTQLGALVYVDREPFTIKYYSGSGGGYVDAILARARQLEWLVDGRNVAGFGHPYCLHKFKAA